jgi:cobalamin synthase
MIFLRLKTMKKYRAALDFILILSLTVVCALALAPKSFVMPNSAQMLILTILLGFIATFLVLLWRENPGDEREAVNQASASRAAYVVGAVVLIIALIIQSLQHKIDPAVPLALLAMISTKVFVQRMMDNK